ncbi:hypothetical protein L1765_10300 [Microaerobacter geothermalis]|uniref:hypothetical protein n=1 Tax=Microaerobacter geothermalis TaxID=674972 RepID=UPI001F160917|nr:hypothetical protein [Microaerobacter geothermalis]MCF6094354.1 hypothetical protein [Microaerobacter geothermalis]
MEIILIRHGRSNCEDNHYITAKEFADWINKYDREGIIGAVLFIIGATHRKLMVQLLA